MITLIPDELGNTYVDKKGILWEICDYLGEHSVQSPGGSLLRRRIYEAVSKSGLTKILVADNGAFVKPFGDVWYQYHDSNGELCLKIEHGKRYTNEELGRKD